MREGKYLQSKHYDITMNVQGLNRFGFEEISLGFLAHDRLPLLRHVSHVSVFDFQGERNTLEEQNGEICLSC